MTSEIDKREEHERFNIALEKLQEILDVALDYIIHDDPHHLKLKFAFTPPAETLKLVKIELNRAQEALMNHGREHTERIADILREYQQYYRHVIIDKKTDDMTKRFVEYELNWIKYYLRSCFTYEDEWDTLTGIDFVNINLDALHYDSDLLMDNLHNIESLIKIEGLNEIVSIIKEVEHFKQLFDSYHVIKEDMYASVDNNSSRYKRSYNWLGNKTEFETDMTELYYLLVPEFIQKETSLEAIKDVFSGKKTSQITPIKWLKNPSELLYFILQLQESNLLKKGRRTDYIQLKACFVDKEGNAFKSKFKNMKVEIDTLISSANRMAIDNIVNKLT